MTFLDQVEEENEGSLWAIVGKNLRSPWVDELHSINQPCLVDTGRKNHIRWMKRKKEKKNSGFLLWFDRQIVKKEKKKIVSLSPPLLVFFFFNKIVYTHF